MSEVETGSCHGFIEYLFIILGTIFTILEGLLHGAIIVGIIICFAIWFWAIFRMVNSFWNGKIEEKENE